MSPLKLAVLGFSARFAWLKLSARSFMVGKCEDANDAFLATVLPYRLDHLQA
jgi:hypothetical protein